MLRRGRFGASLKKLFAINGVARRIMPGMAFAR
jgi:hypothetical protein